MHFFFKMINQNTEITQEIKKGLGLSELTGYPRKVADAIIPVLPVNKKYITIGKHKNSDGTVYTTPANKDFYLTNIMVSVSATGGGTAYCSVVGTINGEAQTIAYINCINTVEHGTSASYNLINPIKLDRNTNIVLDISDAGAAHILGYTEDITGD